MTDFTALLGMACIVGFAVLLSENRRAIQLRTVVPAFLLQSGFALLVLYVPAGKLALASAAQAVQFVIDFSGEGIRFVFGPLGSADNEFIFAFRVLPIIIFFSSLMSVLYYLHIMQWVIRLIGGFLRRIMATRPVESLNAAANIFVGQTDAPLAIRPYVAKVSNVQLFAIMVSGTASISGSMLTGYASMGISLEYLLAASFMSAPAGLLMAKLMLPATEPEAVELDVEAASDEEQPDNVIAAAAEGATKGLSIAVSVAAMLIAFVSLIALLNGLLGLVGNLLGLEGLSFEAILGTVLGPLMFLMGIPWEDAHLVGNLVGEKFILNEFVAYLHMIRVQDQLSEHSVAVVTFALCGFANLSSMAVLIGGLGSIAPSRRQDVARMGLKAVIAGSLANLMSASLASIILSVP